MILAVAVSVGVRRVLSVESIYTLKLFRRQHAIPKALHANMFLVERARDVMARDFVLAPAEMTFDVFLSGSDHGGRMRHVVVTKGDHILGALRINTRFRQASALARSKVTLADIADRNVTIVREDDVVFEIIQRLWRKRSLMALVVRGHGVPRAPDVIGVITKEHVADTVASSVKVYPT